MTRVRPLTTLLLVTCIGSACSRPAVPPSAQLVTTTRPGGSWQGTGNRTIGFISESGRFRISWETRGENPPGSGTFRLTVRSAVSGRTIQVAADHRGAGRGTAEVADDPRPYDFAVDSTNLEWSFSVEEVVAVPAGTPASPSPPRD